MRIPVQDEYLYTEYDAAVIVQDKEEIRKPNEEYDESRLEISFSTFEYLTTEKREKRIWKLMRRYKLKGQPFLSVYPLQYKAGLGYTAFGRLMACQDCILRP